MVASLVLCLRSNNIKRYVQARILDTASLYKASDGSPKAPRRPRRLAAAFPEASHPLLHREARKGSPEARKGGAFQSPKMHFVGLRFSFKSTLCGQLPSSDFRSSLDGAGVGV